MIPPNRFIAKKRQRFTVLPFLLFLLLSDVANATHHIPPLNGTLKQKWYNLGHYDEQGVSEIVNDDFFIAPHGRKNAAEEYEAFLVLLSRYIARPSDAKAQEILCKFPARMSLMQGYLHWFNESHRPTCEAYESSVRPDHITSVSLIYASGYFDNPASYYGHTLIRFNYDDMVLKQKTLDASLNYGAQSTNQAGTVMYILNGLLGGYTASYHKNNDFIHSHRYTNGQLRDLWEYELNLTHEQRRFIVEHGWEMMHAKFTYYFLNDNCAHRIANLIERATGQSLSESHGKWLMPIQVLQSAKNKRINGAPLIAKETYHPSLKSSFTKRYQQLSEAEKSSFIEFFNAEVKKKNTTVNALSHEAMLLALEQLDIQVAKLTIEKDSSTERRNALEHQRRILLFELLRKPPIEKRDELEWGHLSLLNYRSASIMRAGYANRSGRNVLNLRYQIANNDLLDVPMAGQAPSRFIMGALEADIRVGENAQIREATLVDITNLNTNVLPIRMTNEFSWQIKIGYEHRNRTCTSCGSLGVTGKAGKAEKITDDVMVYSLLGGRLNHKKTKGYGYVSAISENGLIYDMQSHGRFNLGFDVTFEPFEGDTETIAKSDYALRIGPENDVRLGLETDFEGGSLIKLNVGYFFN